MTRNISGKENTDIKALIDRYMAGETTNEEETTMRQWFRLAGDAIPDEWRPLRALLSFVDEERDALSADNDEDATPHGSSRMTLLMHCLRQPRTWISTAVAVAAVSIAFVVPAFTGDNGDEPQSYAVIDGKVYTTPSIVKKEAMNAIHAVSTDDDPFSALNMMQ